VFSTEMSAQFKYQNGRLILSNIDPYAHYMITVASNGAYFNHIKVLKIFKLAIK